MRHWTLLVLLRVILCTSLLRADPPQPVATIECQGVVDLLAFSSDGARLAMVVDGAALVREVKTGRELAQFKSPAGAIATLLFLPDGKTLATAHQDRTVHLWDIDNAKESKQLVAHRGAIGALAVSPDGKLLASGGADKQVRITEISTGREVQCLVRQSEWWVGSLAFAKGGKLLLAGGYDGNIRVWETDNGQEIKTLAVPMFTGMSLSGDGKTLACNGPGDSICLWEVGTWKVRHTFGRHGPMDLSIAMSSDGRFIAERAKEEKILRVWNRLSGTKIVDLATGGPFAWIPDTGGLAVGSGKVVSIYDLSKFPNAQIKPAEDPPGMAAELWGQLTAVDPVAAHAAILRLAAGPASGVELIESRLQALAGQAMPDEKVLSRLIAELDDDVWKVRENATRELGALGRRITPRLQKELKTVESPEARLRLEGLLQAMAVEGTTTPEELAASRGIEVLELIGDAKSKQILSDLAERGRGQPGGDDAAAALGRLKKRHPLEIGDPRASP